MATVIFLTTNPGSNQTFNVPADWNNNSNFVETIAGGGSGAATQTVGAPTVTSVTGGGAGAYSKQSNISLTPGGTATYQIGVGGAAVATTTSANGNDGGDSWFNGATLAASSVGAKAGLGGATGIGVNTNGGAGGAAGSGIGTTKNSGGRGGNTTGGANIVITGGGGAAGPNGNGNNGVDSGVNGASTNGGSGDAGSGGAAGTGNTNGNGGNGGNGSEFDATHGSGGGGGGGERLADTNTSGGSGGNYGAGGGGCLCGVINAAIVSTSGAGIQGVIVITYTPVVNTVFTRDSDNDAILAHRFKHLSYRY